MLADRAGTNVRYVFFVDSLYLIKLKEEAKESNVLKSDYEKIISQLKNLVEKGHDLQLHLHPQWFYAKYNIKVGKWEQDFNHYKLDDCSLPDVEIMVRESVDLLETISGYKPTAYRAGGYCFPQKQEYKAILKRYGITKDSSVIMGKSASGKYQTFNYSKIRCFNSYSFDDISQMDNKGSFTEYPISAIRINPLKYYFIIMRVKSQNGVTLMTVGDGKGVVKTLPLLKRISEKVLSIFKTVYMPASVDKTNVLWLDKVYREAIDKRSDIMVIIGHPKNLTAFALERLEQFVRENKINSSTFRDNLEKY